MMKEYGVAHGLRIATTGGQRQDANQGPDVRSALHWLRDQDWQEVLEHQVPGPVHVFVPGTMMCHTRTRCGVG